MKKEFWSNVAHENAIIRGVSGVRDDDVTFYRVCHNLQKGDREKERKKRVWYQLYMFVLNMNYLNNTVISQITLLLWI